MGILVNIYALCSAMGASAMIVSVYLNSFVGMLMGFYCALGFSPADKPFMISL